MNREKIEARIIIGESASLANATPEDRRSVLQDLRLLLMTDEEKERYYSQQWEYAKGLLGGRKKR